jgi:hypothetical protein
MLLLSIVAYLLYKAMCRIGCCAKVCNGNQYSSPAAALRKSHLLNPDNNDGPEKLSTSVYAAFTHERIKRNDNDKSVCKECGKNIVA